MVSKLGGGGDGGGDSGRWGRLRTLAGISQNSSPFARMIGIKSYAMPIRESSNRDSRSIFNILAIEIVDLHKKWESSQGYHLALNIRPCKVLHMRR